MPHAVDIALGAGLTSLYGAAPETVTFRGATVTALLNRAVAPPSLPTGRPDFTARNMSSVMLPASILTAPKAGELITDSSGTKLHRIQKSQWNGFGWICECEVT